MRITCPSCQAAYDVAVLPAGRVVQCARCAARWTPVVPAIPLAVAPAVALAAPLPTITVMPAQAPPPLAQPSVRYPDELAPGPAEPQDRPPAWIAVAAWAASLALLGAAAAAAVIYRAPVMHAWPPSQRLFAALGLG